MSIGIIERLLHSTASRSNGNVPLIAYFFCQNTDYRLNTMYSIMKGLRLQMIKQRSDLRKCLRSHWDSKNNRFYGAMSWRKLWDIFLEMIGRCQDATIHIIVDTLDECQDDGMSEFLRVIIRTSSLNTGKVKCLLTSRPLGDAEKELLASKDQAQVKLELNSANVNQAIKRFIAAKMEEIDRHQRLHLKLRQMFEQELINRSDGTYLWVSLVYRDLEKTQSEEMLERAQKLPKDLESLYKQKFAELSTGDSASKCMRKLGYRGSCSSLWILHKYARGPYHVHSPICQRLADRGLRNVTLELIRNLQSSRYCAKLCEVPCCGSQS